MGLGTGPYLEKGFDVQMTDLGDRYFVQIGSPEGAKTINYMSFLFRKSKRADYSVRSLSQLKGKVP